MIRLVVDNGPDPLLAAWEEYSALAIEMAAMFGNPHGQSSAARFEHAKDLLRAEARFRDLFAQAERARTQRELEDPCPF